MKHIKIFEQFDDDPFGEENYGHSHGDLKIIRSNSNKELYIAKSITNNMFRLFDVDNGGHHYTKDVNMDPVIEDHEKINIYNPSIRLWQSTSFASMSNQLKNRLINDLNKIK